MREDDQIDHSPSGHVSEVNKKVVMRKSAFGMNGSFTFSFMPPQYTQSLCSALLAYYLSAVFGASFPVAGQRNIPCSSVFLCYHFGSKRCANNKLYCPTSFVTVVTFLLHFTEKVFLISNVTDNILFKSLAIPTYITRN